MLKVGNKRILRVGSMDLFKFILLLLQSLIHHFPDHGFLNIISAGCGHILPPNTKSCGNILSILPQPFSCKAKPPLCLISRSKAVESISVGLLTCVSSDNLSAFSGGSPNDWLSPTTGYLDTYSAGCAGTFTPFSCSAGQSSRAPPGHGNIYSVKNKNGYDAVPEKRTSP